MMPSPNASAHSPVSPKPRKYTFPKTHNFSDSPCPSPCASPFEPDRRRTTPSPPLSIDTVSLSFSPSSSLASPSSCPSPATTSSSSVKRRKTSLSPDVERIPKKGDQDYVKRPQNAFMLFRRAYCDEHFRIDDNDPAEEGKPRKPRQADLSKMISQEWKSLPAEERQRWHDLAAERKKEHGVMYPNYVYRPQRQRDELGNVKKNKKRVKRGDHDPEKDPPDHITFVLPNQTVGRSSQRRSLSAPNQSDTYQTIHIPNVYMTPSCPTSPTLTPLYKRRSAHPGHPEDNFDYRQDAASGFQPSNFSWPPLDQQTPFDSSSSSPSSSSCTTTTTTPFSTPFNTAAAGYPSSSAQQHSPPSPSAPLTPTGPTTPRLGEPYKMEPNSDPWLSSASSTSGMMTTSAFVDDPSSTNNHNNNGGFYWSHDANEFIGYNSPWDSNLSWQDGPMFSADDFDINAIPSMAMVGSAPSQCGGGGGDFAIAVGAGGGGGGGGDETCWYLGQLPALPDQQPFESGLQLQSSSSGYDTFAPSIPFYSTEEMEMGRYDLVQEGLFQQETSSTSTSTS